MTDLISELEVSSLKHDIVWINLFSDLLKSIGVLLSIERFWGSVTQSIIWVETQVVKLLAFTFCDTFNNRSSTLDSRFEIVILSSVGPGEVKVELKKEGAR